MGKRRTILPASLRELQPPRRFGRSRSRAMSDVFVRTWAAVPPLSPASRVTLRAARSSSVCDPSRGGRWTLVGRHRSRCRNPATDAGGKRHERSHTRDLAGGTGARAERGTAHDVCWHSALSGCGDGCCGRRQRVAARDGGSRVATLGQPSPTQAARAAPQRTPPRRATRAMRGHVTSILFLLFQ